jgi:N-methylhydantoinase A/oxoprolinase/acetone carboxylase beta subunit
LPLLICAEFQECWMVNTLAAVTQCHRHCPQPLDAAAPAAAFAALAAEVAAAAAEGTPAMSAEEVAAGFLRVAIEAMCRPIRNLTTMKV